MDTFVTQRSRETLTCTSALRSARQGRPKARIKTHTYYAPSPTSSPSRLTFEYRTENITVPEEFWPIMEPVKIGDLLLAHRIVYPPLTRNRAFGNTAHPHMAEYYKQRTTKGGLIITEATVVAKEGHGYPCTPGIYTREQVESWKPVVKAVKDEGGVFFCQLWHCGRASHPDYQPGGAAPLAPSPIAIGDGWEVYTEKPPHGPYKYPVPQALDKADIKRIVGEFRQAARNALDAGFDGVEIHGANGYLLDQFLKDSSNQRSDEYGGCLENRARFMLEVVQAVADEVGPHRTGLKLSPFTAYLNATDSMPYATFMYVIEKLTKQKVRLAYLQLVEPRYTTLEVLDESLVKDGLQPFRALWPGVFMVTGGYNETNTAQAISSGHADLVAVGRPYIANPDMIKRWLLGAPLNTYDRNTFYTQGMEGYIDYPFLDKTN